MKIKLVTLIVILFAAICDAKADVGVYLGGWSKHIASSHANNNTQNAVIFNYNDFLIGRYENSFYSDETFVVGYEYHIKSISTENIDFSISPMLTKGYRICPGHKYTEYDDDAPARTCAIATFNVKYTEYRLEPVLTLSPTALTFMLHLKF